MSVPGVLNAQDRGAPLEKLRYMDGSEEGAKLQPGVTSPKESLSRVACGTAGPLAVSLGLGACGHVPATLGIHEEAKEYSRRFAGAIASRSDASKSGACKSGVLELEARKSGEAPYSYSCRNTSSNPPASLPGDLLCTCSSVRRVLALPCHLF
jgi:hypothetical protein